MWENILILGVKPVVDEKAKKAPRLSIFGMNEEGDKRIWSVFANKLKIDDDDVYIFSSRLHLALAAVVPKLENLYQNYEKAIKDKDKDAFVECERKLFKTVHDAAAEFSKVRDLQDDKGPGAIEEIRQKADVVSKSLDEYLAKHVIRVDWELSERDGGEAKFAGPANHALCMKKSKIDGVSTFGDVDVEEEVERFRQGKEYDPEQSMDDALSAIQGDYDDDDTDDSDLPI